MNYTGEYYFKTDVSYVFLEKLRDKLKDKKVLDIGCGRGDYLGYFGKDSLGLDLSPNNLAEARRRGLRVRETDLNQPFTVDEKFDCIFSSNVLEHLESPLSHIRQMNKLLDVGGKLILSVPNEHSVIHFKYPYFHGDGNHLFSFSVSNIFELLGQTGFSIEKVHYDYYPHLIRELTLEGIVSLVDFLPARLKTPFAWSYWFECTKVKSL